jgi:thiol:disulfide interchange protein
MDLIQPLRSVEELEAALKKAGSQRMVVIKFYARWCKSCKVHATMPPYHNHLGDQVLYSMVQELQGAQRYHAAPTTTLQPTNHAQHTYTQPNPPPYHPSKTTMVIKFYARWCKSCKVHATISLLHNHNTLSAQHATSTAAFPPYSNLLPYISILTSFPPSCSLKQGD